MTTCVMESILREAMQDPGVTPPTDGAAEAGAKIYARRCAVCHGDHREGAQPSSPALVGIGSRLTASQVKEIVHNGKNGMPAFPSLKDEDLGTLLRFLGVEEKA